MTTRVCYLGVKGGELFLDLILPHCHLPDRIGLKMSLEVGEQLGEAILHSVRSEKERTDIKGEAHERR